jgi:predicted RND superfamily exporter protein
VVDLPRNPFLRFPVATIGVMVVACVLSITFSRVDVDSEMEDLLSGDQRNRESYEAARKILGENVPIVVSLDCGQVYSPSGIKLISRLTHALGTVSGATSTYTNVYSGLTNTYTMTNVHSLVTATLPVRKGLSLEWQSIVPPILDETGLVQLRRWSQSHPFARNILVGEDGRHTVIIANYNRPLKAPEEQARFHAEISEAVEPFRNEGFSVRVIGLPLIEHEIRTSLKEDMRRFVPVALCVLMGVLIVTFWSVPRLIVYVLANQIMGMVLLPALYELTGLRLNIFTILLVPLLTGIHLAMLVHVATAFQRAWMECGDRVMAIKMMWAEVIRASAFAALTTAIGLLALLASEVMQLREFGVLGAVGIGMLFILTFGPGLAWLPVLISKTVDRQKTQTSSRRIDLWARRVKEAYQPMMLLLVLGVVVIIAGISQVRTDVRPSEFLNSQSPARLMIEEMDEAYGGINIVQLEIDSGRTNGINHPVLLSYLDRVHQAAEREKGVTAVYSYAQLMAVINEVWEGGKPGSFQLPTSAIKSVLFSGIVNSQKAQLPFLTMLCDTNFQTAQLTLRTRDMSSKSYLELLERMEKLAKKEAPEGVKVSAQSGIRSILEADRRIVRSQQQSVLWTVGLIGLVLAILWRSIGLALLALGVNLLPVGLIVALQGLVGVPLNSITIMVAAIALGIAVDDTIHFITHWRDKWNEGASPGEAACEAMRVKGRPILATTAILVGMMMVFWISTFPPVVHFGLLLSVGLAGALVAALVLLPAWLGRMGE